MLKGVDVSNHQAFVSWGAVAMSGRTFAYLKASEGRTFVDRYFASNYRNVQSQDMIAGAYHFARPGTSAKLQVDNFLAVYKPKVGDLIPCLDVEVTDGLNATAMAYWIKDFVTEYYNRTKIYPIIYTSPGWWNGEVADNDASRYVVAHCPLWIAHWGVSRPSLPRGWKTWTVWQFTSSGRVPGVNGRCDENNIQDMDKATIGPSAPKKGYDILVNNKPKFKNVSESLLLKRVLGQLKKAKEVLVRKR